MIREILFWSQALDNSGDDDIFIYRADILREAKGELDWDYVVNETTRIVDAQDNQISEEFIEIVYCIKYNSVKFNIFTNDTDNTNRLSYITATVYLDNILNLSNDSIEIKGIISQFVDITNITLKDDFEENFYGIVENLQTEINDNDTHLNFIASLDIGKKQQLKKSKAELEESIKHYNNVAEIVKDLSYRLFEKRVLSKKLIQDAEDFVNSLANSPKEFDKSFKMYYAEFEVFTNLIEEFNKQTVDIELEAIKTGGAGILTGLGIASLAPPAAMAIATTFGIASTGTAIATLSGVAASNAALAWLGGGALAAGGAGMAGGTALIAMFGPVGISVGVVFLLGSSFLLRSKNIKVIKKAEKKKAEIATLIATNDTACVEIKHLIRQTDEQTNGISGLLSKLKSFEPDYKKYSETQKETLGAMINHVYSLSKLLNYKVK